MAPRRTAPERVGRDDGLGLAGRKGIGRSGIAKRQDGAAQSLVLPQHCLGFDDLGFSAVEEEVRGEIRLGFNYQVLCHSEGRTIFATIQTLIHH
jgi:hypothetical protein